jgi:hypothetical protein
MEGGQYSLDVGVTCAVNATSRAYYDCYGTDLYQNALIKI